MYSQFLLVLFHAKYLFEQLQNVDKSKEFWKLRVWGPFFLSLPSMLTQSIKSNRFSAFNIIAANNFDALYCKFYFFCFLIVTYRSIYFHLIFVLVRKVFHIFILFFCEVFIVRIDFNINRWSLRYFIRIYKLTKFWNWNHFNYLALKRCQFGLVQVYSK